MSENSELLAAVKALLAQTQAPVTPQTIAGWSAPQAAPAGLIQGVAVPVRVDTPIGAVRLYVSLPAEAAQSPQALLGAIQTLVSMGLPVDAWNSRESSGWSRTGNGGGWNRSGGYGRGRY